MALREQDRFVKDIFLVHYKDPIDVVFRAYRAANIGDDFGAENGFSTYGVQDALETARIIANRGELSIGEALMRAGKLPSYVEPFYLLKDENLSMAVIRMLAQLSVIPGHYYVVPGSFTEGSEHEEFIHLLGGDP